MAITPNTEGMEMKAYQRQHAAHKALKAASARMRRAARAGEQAQSPEAHRKALAAWSKASDEYRDAMAMLSEAVAELRGEVVA